APNPTGAAPLRPALKNFKTLSQRRKNKEPWRRGIAPAFRLILQLENAVTHAAVASISLYYTEEQDGCDLAGTF
ncbi:MAG TPA: hypothetical protein VGV35_20570, partial [Bryobacteraceae bacterium]|nr:hypothetical protein [Bryobacteraceae bacterium]